MTGSPSGQQGPSRLPELVISIITDTPSLSRYILYIVTIYGYDVVKLDKKCNTCCIFDEVSVVSSVVSGPPEARGRCNAINNWVEVKSEE